MRRAVFFDLDGTLLPIDMEAFSQAYFKQINKNGLFEKIDDKQGSNIFGKAIYAMLNNQGQKLNCDVFFDEIEAHTQTAREELVSHMDGFYTNEFLHVRECTRSDERVLSAVRQLKHKGYRLILATNPLFPRVATNTRIAWAGLEPGDFEYISYYDNSHYCKPNPKYFIEILNRLELKASECYIVGNDIVEDMGAVALGFKGFLVLDHVIGDLKKVPQCEQGNYSDLLRFAENLSQAI